MALKLRTIDACIWSIPGLEDIKLKEVDKYVLLEGWHPVCMNVLVNMDVWNALGPDLQRQIQDRIDANHFKLWKGTLDYQEGLIDEAKAYGVEFLTLSPDMRAKMRAAARTYWDQVAAMGPAAAEGVELYKAWLEYNGIPW